MEQESPEGPLPHEVLAAVVEAAPDGILVVDAEGRILLANAAIQELFGFSRQELVGQRIELLVADDERGRHAELRKSFTSDLRPRLMGASRPVLGMHKDGSLLEVEVGLSPFAPGCEKGPVVAMVRDLRPRRALEDARRMEAAKARAMANRLESIRTDYENLSARFDMLMRMSPVLFWAENEATSERFFSEAGASAVTGYDAAELARLRGGWLDLVVEEDLDQLLGANQYALESGQPTSFECRIRTRQGEEAWLCGLIAPHPPTSGTTTGVCGVAIDCTERKLAQQQLEVTREELAQLRRLEGIGRLAAGVAHDFSNLLTGIMGFTEDAIRQHRQRGQEPPSSLGEVLRASERGAELTRQLLTFGRRDARRATLLDLNEVVRSMLTMLRRLIGDDIVIREQLTTAPCVLRADRGRIEQVLLNLVVNARDAMTSGGEIRVATRVAAADECPEEMQSAENGVVVLCVQDTGAGLDPVARERLFEPLFTTKGDAGTGLGLPTTLHAVQGVGGCIHVTSKAGAGTRFEIYLPRCEPASPRPSGIAPSGKRKVSGKGRHVLVVEDDALVRRVVQRVLQRAAFDVTAVEGPKAALDAQQRAERPFDLVVSDIVMPDLRGPQLVQELRVRQPELPALLTSGFVDPLECRPPKDFFLPKPFGAEELLRTVEHLLETQDVAGQ